MWLFNYTLIGRRILLDIEKNEVYMVRETLRIHYRK